MNFHRKLIAVFSSFILINAVAFAQNMTVVQPFEGSSAIGKYEAEFDQVTILIDQGEADAKSVSVEGAVSATLLKSPDDKSVLEIARSYEQTLEAEGFEILFSRRIQRTKTPSAQVGKRAWITELRDANSAREFERSNSSVKLTTSRQAIYGFPAYYLSARKVGDTEEIHVALTIEDYRSNYLIEQVSRAVMATGTVSLGEEQLKSGIETEGKAVLYGVQFDVGSSVLRPSSRDSLETIAAVLRQRTGRFYVVGHTSDTGDFAKNIALSEARAASIIKTLGSEYGIDTARLQPIGVGPAAPLASNQNEAGRQLNRRVELVERLN